MPLTTRYLIHDPRTGQTAAVDTPCATAYKKELERRGWTLSHIFNTHKHHDHVGGNEELKGDGVKIFGPASDGNIPGMDVPLKGGDKVSFAGSEAEIIGRSILANICANHHCNDSCLILNIAF